MAERSSPGIATALAGSNMFSRTSERSHSIVIEFASLEAMQIARDAIIKASVPEVRAFANSRAGEAKALADKIEAAWRWEHRTSDGRFMGSLNMDEQALIVAALRSPDEVGEAKEAREIVTGWLGMFDPPPQIDFQQSELLQGAISAALRSHAVAATPPNPADEMIGQIEARFPNWKSFRDLVDCIDCTLHNLRHLPNPKNQ